MYSHAIRFPIVPGRLRSRSGLAAQAKSMQTDDMPLSSGLSFLPKLGLSKDAF
jgi:hypothetical protein